MLQWAPPPCPWWLVLLGAGSHQQWDRSGPALPALCTAILISANAYRVETPTDSREEGKVEGIPGLSPTPREVLANQAGLVMCTATAHAQSSRVEPFKGSLAMGRHLFD